MKNLKTIQLLLLCLFMLTLALPSHAAVRSMTVAKDVKSNGLKIGKKVVVACRDEKKKHEIFKKSNENEWCDVNFGDVCSSKKSVAAQRVCSGSYRQRMSAKNSNDAVEVVKPEDAPDVVEPNDVEGVAALRKELMDIEQKRLDIAKKVLELRRRELQLQSDN